LNNGHWCWTNNIFRQPSKLSAGHRSLTGKISQFDRQILSPGGHVWPVNFLIKKYIQNGALFPIFQRSVCPSMVQANKGGEVTHFLIQIRYTASIVP
jgi:hypothetical protein